MIRIGIVGAGGMGAVHHANYAHIPDCAVTALVGISPHDEQRAAEWNLPLYPDVPTLLREEPLDVVDICTPTFLHKEQALGALAGGAHVIVEKPIALRLADAQAMYAAAEKENRLLLVAQVLQFTEEVEFLRALVESGEYGKPLDGYFTRLTTCPQWLEGGWLFDREKSGLLPFDLHIHDLDILVSIFGKPLDYRYTSCGSSRRSYREQYRFTYFYEGFTIAAEAAWFHASFPFSAGWRMAFEDAVVLCENASITIYPYDAPVRKVPVEDLPKIPTGINVPPTGMYLKELRHFIGCIKNGKSSQRVKKQQVLDVVEILERIASE